MARIPDHVQLTLEYRKGSANGNADFFSHLPLPATERDRSGPSSLTPSDEERVFLIRAPGLLLGGPSAMRVGLGRLAPSDPISGLGGLTRSPDDFRAFHQHGPRMRVDDLGAPSGEFVVRAPVHVASRGTHGVFPVNACASDPVALPRSQPLRHLCLLLPMARITANTPSPSRFHSHCLTTIHRTLAR